MRPIVNAAHRTAPSLNLNTPCRVPFIWASSPGGNWSARIRSAPPLLSDQSRNAARPKPRATPSNAQRENGNNHFYNLNPELPFSSLARTLELAVSQLHQCRRIWHIDGWLSSVYGRLLLRLRLQQLRGFRKGAKANGGGRASISLPRSSFPRKRESTENPKWAPAYAGATRDDDAGVETLGARIRSKTQAVATRGARAATTKAGK